jgi:hypothetical protein
MEKGETGGADDPEDLLPWAQGVPSSNLGAPTNAFNGLRQLRESSVAQHVADL